MKRLILLVSVTLLFAMAAFAAAADGTWLVATSNTNVPQKLVLQTSGSALAGTADTKAISHGGTNGNDLWFQVTTLSGTEYYKGTISGSQLKLYPNKGGGPITYNHQ